MSKQDPDVQILQSVRWRNGQDDQGVLAAIRATRRFIDFDDTIADELTGHPRERLCTVPLVKFLTEERFIVQTWNARGAMAFFSWYAELPIPMPELILAPPRRTVGKHPPADGEVEWLAGITAKDFEALGLTGKFIIDDWVKIGGIHAPGCTIVHPDEPLPELAF